MDEYRRIHRLLAEERGLASKHLCVMCPAPAHDWAYAYTGTSLRTPDGKVYSEDIWNDYLPMCKSCHKKQDHQKDERVREAVRKGALKAGAKRGQQIAEQAKTDPEFRAKLSAQGTANMKALWIRAETDPELRQRLIEKAKRQGEASIDMIQNDPRFAAGRLKGSATVQAKRAADPEFDRHMTEQHKRTAAKLNTTRVVCLTCGLETTAGPMALHAKKREHKGNRAR